MNMQTLDTWQERALDRFEVLRSASAAAFGAARAANEQVIAAAAAARDAERVVRDAERRPPATAPVRTTPAQARAEAAQASDQAQTDAARALARAQAGLRRAIARRAATEAERNALGGRARAAGRVLVKIGLLSEQEVLP